MIIFENEGEIDPQLVMLIGVNVKESESAIGYFGTGLKYAIACLTRWGEEIRIQSGSNEFSFSKEPTEIRGKSFELIQMHSKFDTTQLGFTTELGKRWEPWMVYRELWCNAVDEPGARVWEDGGMPARRPGLTRVVVSGSQIEQAHHQRHHFILDSTRKPLHVVEGLEIYDGPGEQIFYRGIAVQRPSKPGLLTYNITNQMFLTEDRTAGSWETNPRITRGLTQLEDSELIERLLLAGEESLESQLDYSWAYTPGETWIERARELAKARPLDIPTSVRSRFVEKETKVCPTCGREMD